MPQWLPEQDDLLRSGVSYAEIARKTGHTDAAVQKRAQALGITGPYRPWTPDEDDLVAFSDMPAAVLAEELGRTERAIRHRASKLGVSLAAERIRWTHKEMQTLRDPGLSYNEKVERIGRSRQSVSAKLSELRREGEGITCARTCLDCGADISNRKNSALRCRDHDASSHAGNVRRYLKDPRRSIERSVEWGRKNPDKRETSRRAWAERNPDYYKERHRHQSDAQKRVTLAASRKRAADRQARGPQMDWYRPWTPEEDAIVLGDLSIMERAWKLNRSVSSINNRYHRLTTGTAGASRTPPWTDREIKLLMDPDLTPKEISRRTGRSEQSIAVKRSKMRQEGTDLPLLVTPWTAREDGILSSSGLTVKELAQKLGRSESAICQRAIKLGIGMKRDDRWWSPDDLAIIQDPKLTIDEMVELTGRSKTAIASKRHKLRRSGRQISKRCKNKRIG